jgi:hypothetical protein
VQHPVQHWDGGVGGHLSKNASLTLFGERMRCAARVKNLSKTKMHLASELVFRLVA